jgi:amidase
MDRRSFLNGAGAVAASVLFCPLEARSAAPDLDFASALDAARAIRTGRVSSVELTNRMLARIALYNPKVNAIVTLTADAALARARAADEARARGEWWGPFHGVPATIKDTFETAGVRTTAGSTTLTNHVPAGNAVVVERLRRAGVVILGKTNVPDMAGDWQSYNDVFGMSRNPWDLERTPGGSSGGEATALAAGLTYVTIGSDIGGSIRVPAHFCGVYGHKPTIGVIPLRGHVPPPPGTPPFPPSPLAVAGPLARNAADLKASIEALGGPDGDDGLAYRWSLPAGRGARVADYRIGYVLDDRACPVSAELKPALEGTIDALRKAGATLEEGWPAGIAPDVQYATYLDLLWAAFSFLMRADQVDAMRALAASEPDSHRRRQARAWTASPRYLSAAHSRRLAARAAWQEYFRTHDAFVMPTSFVPAFPHDQGPSLFDRRLVTPAGLREYLDLFYWISFATLTGLPATTAPVGRTASGLPVGIQIMGPYLEDATPIDIAGKLADLVGGFTPPPGYS